MLDTIKGLFTISSGSKVKVVRNSNNHSHTIGNVYEVTSDVSRNRYNGNGRDYERDRFLTLDSNSYEININDVELVLDKDVLIDELLEVIEFIKDNEVKLTDTKVNKEYKMYKLLKLIKGTKNDFEKIKILSKYL